MRQKGISVVICCYNASERLPKTLEHVLNQQTKGGTEWEIIVVNNNSTDNTSLVANDILASARQQIPFQVVDEPTPGLSNARKKGYDTAKYDFLLLVDDDNWLTPSYIQNVFELFDQNPDVGIVGGEGEPVFEEDPPVWFDEFASCYALGPQAQVPANQTWEYADFIYGAGLGMRMTAYDQLKEAGYKSILSDRKGGSLISGGDTELCMAMRLGSYKLIFDNRLKFKHLMPKGRINWPYLVKLTHGFGRASVKTQIYEHYLLGHPLPNLEMRFPLWLDRWLNLFRAFPLYWKFFFLGWMKSTKGNAAYLAYVGWKGRLAELMDLKGEYQEDHKRIADLTESLKSVRK